MKPGDIDWDALFGREGARWLHTGGIFAALSETSAAVAKEAMTAAKRHGTIVSYDLNYRASLWKSIGGQKRAREVNRELAPFVDVMLGNEEDFTAALGFEVPGHDEHLSALDPSQFGRMIEPGRGDLPELLGGRHHAAQREDRDPQRLGRRVLPRGALRGAEARRPGDPRPGGRRRLVRLRALYGFLAARARSRRSSAAPLTAPSP